MQSASNALLVAAGLVLLGSTVAQAQPVPPTEKKQQPAAAAPPAQPPARTEDPSSAAEPGPEAPAEPARTPEPSTKAGEVPKEVTPSEQSAEPAPAEQPPEELPPAAPAETAPPALQGLPLLPQSSTDLAAAPDQTEARSSSTQGRTEAPGDRVYAEQWWTHARPTLELHGYFRVRAELFHKFALDRRDAPHNALWPQPLDNVYTDANNRTYGADDLCTRDEADTGSADDPAGNLVGCRNNTQAGANMRFRLNPELHISDNLRVMSQVDLLDNLVLGSTPGGYRNEPASGYGVVSRTGYSPFGYYDDTQEVPSAGANSLQDSIRVKRVWAEYETPLGQLRFGRMPDHWGLGIVHNGGDDYDADYQSTVDRIMFTTSLKPLSLYISGAWDFPNEGITSAHLSLPQAQAYDLAQLDDVDQYSVIIARKLDPELTELELAKGRLILNGGLYLTYRKQLLASDLPGTCTDGAAALGCTPGDVSAIAGHYVRRGAQAWTPDLWLQLLYKKFRFEAEVVTVQGTIENTDNLGSNYTAAPGEEGWRISEWGFATELSQKLLEDRLKLTFHSGWASGDPDAYQSGGGVGLSPGLSGLQEQIGDDTFSTFRFNPNYRVDLILHRNLLSRVQGTYYFRPGIEYDFLRNPEGQRLGGAFAGIWSRASQFVQTPGHRRDLGIELNGSVYFQGKDGALNDDVERMGGFYTMLQYGVMFPLGGLDYQAEEADRLSAALGGREVDTGIAHVLRWYLGVMF